MKIQGSYVTMVLLGSLAAMDITDASGNVRSETQRIVSVDMVKS